ncbi:ATP-grasp domain-containing protein [Kiloniella laminariae]|uniref:ATP-grasp domain-containing protein n=1 Tax=Kiloniella laminariae TaxID=454162 RepID=A0ABT4LEJ6_9PROT|nr:ATP-grasp domain-containing protein [Kiloniella laminariae]MCZ4279520.1 ATP-grasp domain-containing protein [Kiloniella laminariae]
MMETDILERPINGQDGGQGDLLASAFSSEQVKAGHAAGKTILILGASPDQLPLYQAAKAAGAYVIGADANPNSMARPLADRFLLLKSRSAEDIIIQLDGQALDGVASPGNDSFHQTIYDLCRHYGLPNPPSFSAVAASCDKGFFSSQAQEMGIFAPTHCESKDPEVLKAFAQARALPLIVKPADSSGSKGLSFLQDLDQFQATFDKASSTSPTGLVIIEDYVTGDQFGVEAFRLDGRCVLTAVSQRGHTGPPDFLVTRHSVGFPLPGVLEADLVPAIDRIADALDITNGPLNFDLILAPDGRICFIEMGARLSGNGFPALVRETYGVDTQDWVLRLALGIDIAPPEQFLRPKAYGIQQILTAKKSGWLDGVSGLETLREHPAYKQDTLFVKSGDQVQQFKRTIDRLGVVLLAHEDMSLVNEALSRLETTVTFVIGDDNLSPNLSGNQE